MARDWQVDGDDASDTSSSKKSPSTNTVQLIRIITDVAVVVGLSVLAYFMRYRFFNHVAPSPTPPPKKKEWKDVMFYNPANPTRLSLTSTGIAQWYKLCHWTGLELQDWDYQWSWRRAWKIRWTRPYHSITWMTPSSSAFCSQCQSEGWVLFAVEIWARIRHTVNNELRWSSLVKLQFKIPGHDGYTFTSCTVSITTEFPLWNRSELWIRLIHFTV